MIFIVALLKLISVKYQYYLKLTLVWLNTGALSFTSVTLKFTWTDVVFAGFPWSLTFKNYNKIVFTYNNFLSFIRAKPKNNSKW